MADHVAQAFRDFHEFLSGTRAPALIGQSLATVVVQDQSTVAAQVVSWADAHPEPDKFAALVAARNKVFDIFFYRIQDPQQRREILLANTADRHAIYATKSRFDIANYISQLMEFVIALINDDFFEHGIQVFNVVRQIHKDFKLDYQSTYWQRFKTQSDLIDRQTLAE